MKIVFNGGPVDLDVPVHRARLRRDLPTSIVGNATIPSWTQAMRKWLDEDTELVLLDVHPTQRIIAAMPVAEFTLARVRYPYLKHGRDFWWFNKEWFTPCTEHEESQ